MEDFQGSANFVHLVDPGIKYCMDVQMLNIGQHFLSFTNYGNGDNTESC
jgi:hypothetical protein